MTLGDAHILYGRQLNEVADLQFRVTDRKERMEQHLARLRIDRERGVLVDPEGHDPDVEHPHIVEMMEHHDREVAELEAALATEQQKLKNARESLDQKEAEAVRNG